MCEYSVFAANAESERGQVRHSVAQTADFQLHVNPVAPSDPKSAEPSKVQIDAIRMGVSKLPAKA